MDVKELLGMALGKKASDIHLQEGLSPVFRIMGEIVFSELPVITSEDTKLLIKAMCTEEQIHEFNETNEVDLSYELSSGNRFRVNIFKQRRTAAVSIRVVSNVVPSLQDIECPQIVNKLALLSSGLVLVTGPTGSGKSTTLGAMIRYINENCSRHIVTLEDPIEYMFKSQKSIINQRELDVDTISFPVGLKQALREDPDVILVGEMRDPETIMTALMAAETGHLVLSTLHTSTASQAIERIIDALPPHQQQQTRMQLALVLRGIISQQLLPRSDNFSRIAAFEILTATPAVCNLIREGKTHLIPSTIHQGKTKGMQSMEKSVTSLYAAGKITYETKLKTLDSEMFSQKNNLM